MAGLFWALIFSVYGQHLRPGAWGMEPAENLNGPWKTSDGGERVVPFRPDGAAPLVLSRRIYWDAVPTDTLYLYREGAGWRCETFVNDRLISVSERPFGETLDALAPSFWRRGDNEIRLRLTAGDKDATDGRDAFPPPFAGVHAPVYLLKKTSPRDTLASDTLGPQKTLLPPFSHPRLCSCDTTMWFMPFVSAAEALYSPFEFEVELKRMLGVLPGLRSARGLIEDKFGRWHAEDTLWRRLVADSIRWANDWAWRYYLWQQGDTTVESPWPVDSSGLVFPSRSAPRTAPWERSEFFDEHYGTAGVYFPVLPPMSYLEIMGRYGVCMAVRPGRWNASWRRYASVLGVAPSAWHDQSMSRTLAYGVFEPASVREVGAFSYLVVGLILSTLLWAALWKLFDPTTFRLLNAVGGTNRKLAEAQKESGALRGPMFYVLPALRSWLLAAMATFLLSGLWMRGLPAYDFWHQTALWEGLHRYAARPVALFVRLWGVILTFQVAKWLFLSFLEGIYRRRSIGARWMSVEAVADFPGLWVAAGAAALWALIPGSESRLATLILATTGMVFWVRWRVLWNGGGPALKAPPLIIFLYLCATEALPIFLVFA